MKLGVKQARAAFAALCALLLAVCFSVPALAAELPEPTDGFYAADFAGVLSEETERIIIEKGALLSEQTGAQVVVATIDFTNGLTMEDYAFGLFNAWKIGDSGKDNGLLLLLSIGDDDYWATQGKGLEKKLTSGDLDDILWTNLEEDFAKGDYDAGVRKTFGALISRLDQIYGTDVTNGTTSGVVSHPAASSAAPQSGASSHIPIVPGKKSGIGIIGGVLIALFVLLLIGAVIAVVIFIVIRGSKDDNDPPKPPPASRPNRNPYSYKEKNPFKGKSPPFDETPPSDGGRTYEEAPSLGDLPPLGSTLPRREQTSNSSGIGGAILGTLFGAFLGRAARRPTGTNRGSFTGSTGSSRNPTGTGGRTYTGSSHSSGSTPFSGTKRSSGGFWGGFSGSSRSGGGSTFGGSRSSGSSRSGGSFGGFSGGHHGGGGGSRGGGAGRRR